MKNRTRTEDDVTTIEIIRRDGAAIHVMIDATDLPLLVVFGRTWHAKWCKKGRRFYIATASRSRSSPRVLYLHRFLLGDPVGLEIDHKDRNSLNNCRSNLRAITHRENVLNTPPRNRRRVGGAGVTYRPNKRKWQAQLSVNSTTCYVGLFLTREEALAAVEMKRQQTTNQ